MTSKSASGHACSWTSVSFRVDKGDKIGLVGRNGAGKTTLTKTLAGELRPDRRQASTAPARSATCRRTRAPAIPTTLARTRILDARGLGKLVTGIRQATLDMASEDAAVSEAAMKPAIGGSRSGFIALGGYAAEAEAASIASQPQPCPTASSTSRCQDPLRRPAPAHRAGAHPVLAAPTR